MGRAVSSPAIGCSAGVTIGGFGFGLGFLRRFGFGFGGGAPIVSDAPSTGAAAVAPDLDDVAASGLSPKLSTPVVLPSAGGSAGAVAGVRVKRATRTRPVAIAFDIIAMRSD